MTTHTPGPWKWYWKVEDREANCGVYHEPQPGHAYAIARCPRYEARGQWEANARLIAAAPDLLEALQRIAAGEFPPTGAIDVRKFARAAITKATGQT